MLFYLIRDDCKQYLIENPDLTCEDTANYLAIWCLNLEMEEKHTLMEHVSKQVVAMQYILELAKTMDCDPRSCVGAFFTRSVFTYLSGTSVRMMIYVRRF